MTGGIENIIKAGVAALQQGRILLVPTDTVWGLLTDYENRAGIEKIFKLKKSSPRAMAVLCDSLENITDLELDLTETARKAAEAYWPGALTVVLKAKTDKCSLIMSPRKTVGVRIPGPAELRRLIRDYNRPIAATSANFSGHAAPGALEDVPEDIKSRVDCICRLNIFPTGKASTVIDCTAQKISLIREGAVSFKNIQRVVENS